MPGQTANPAVRILETMLDGFLAVDPNGCCTYVNSSAERMLGRTCVELIGKPVVDAAPAERGTPGHAELQRAITERVAVEIEQYHEPSERWFEVRAHPAPEGELLITLR